ncbi:MAG: MotA/TolQ/ExbB proton channel family protein [Flavobacteriales bacterium]|nr:MotA/TolQ/ExbB proton channel family protein [Flavobacteriales bacterium]
MKKLFALIAILGLMGIGMMNPTSAWSQEGTEGGTEMEQAVDAVEDGMQDAADQATNATNNAVEEVEESAPTSMETEEEVDSLNMYIKRYFIEGGPLFMLMVMICLIIGLALCVERIVYLNMASTNTRKLLDQIDSALQSGGVEAAKEVCRNTRGPVASIFYQGLDRDGASIEEVEKSIESYGGVQMGMLERGLSWISLFIAIAPMLGFLGTVIGMILAFDKIQTAGTMDATIVAGGIKVALITTVSGLVVAIILQIFYNYILSKVDGIILEMEEASIDLVDMLYKRQLTSK